MMATADILSVIEACAKLGVTKFKAGTLEVTFSGYQNAAASATPSQTAQLLEAMRNDQDWLAQDIPPSALPREVE